MPPSSHEATTAKSNSLAKQSVLAANFVPAHLRKVNEWQVTAPFHAAPRPGSSHGMGLKGLLVPFVPICYCVAGQQRISNAKPLHCFPLVAAPSDLYYAVETNRQTVEASSSQSKSKGLDGPLESATRVTPVVDSISSLADYLEVWTNLLELERKEVLLRYENYSQYSRPIGVRPVVAQADITSMKNQTNQQVELVATMDANGIADASPPIMIGDTVLVRPVHLVALPQHDFLNHFIPLQACQWTVDIHCAEVQSTVLSVLRGSKTAANISGVDKIVLSWMNPIEWDVLLCTMTMKISSGGPGNSMEEPMYNFRFVPSVTSHNSCLTALQWLTKSYRGNPHGAMEWLFPNTAPVVSMTLGEVAARDILISSQKLNIKQASFVNMVLGRTQHPSVGLVRPPMVLTGPAGTGRS